MLLVSGCAQTRVTLRGSGDRAQLVVMDFRPLDPEALRLPSVTVLVDAASEVEQSEWVPASALDRYRNHPCETAREVAVRLAKSAEVHIQRFARKNVAAPACDVRPGTPEIRVEAGLWKVDSAAAALDRWHRSSTGESHRVFLVADLSQEPERTFCAATEPVRQSGSWVQLVGLREPLDPPNCLAEAPDAPGERLLAILDQVSLPGRRFRVMRHMPDGSMSLVTRRPSGTEPIELSPGVVTVVLEGTPEEEIGPFILRKGTVTRIRAIETRAPEGGPTGSWWDVEQRDAGR